MRTRKKKHRKRNQFGPISQPWNNIWQNGSTSGPSSANFTFTIPGTYSYYCSYHSWMKGQVIVKPTPAGLTSSTTSASSSTTTSKSTTAVNGTSTSASNATTVVSSASVAIQSLAPLVNALTDLARSFATLTGSAAVPWSVNLSNSLLDSKSPIPALLT